MFWRMLRKDLAEKKGTNLILFLFMCFAQIMVVCSVIILYHNLFGIEASERLVNAADVTMYTVQDLNGIEEQRSKIEKWLMDQENATHVDRTQTIRFRSNAVDFEGVDESASSYLIQRNYFSFSQDVTRNRVTDLDGHFFTLPYGVISVSEYLNRNAGVKIGDKVRITTQMGNVYEFTVGAITKDPAQSALGRLFFNEEDFRVLLSESPIVFDVYYIDLPEGSTDTDQAQLITDYTLREEEFGELVNSHTLKGFNDDRSTSLGLNALMIIISIFLIAMVLVTISFTIKNAIKTEEKELGMLKALGVESFSFNWLFAAKYLAIALLSAVVGCTGGIHLAGLYLKYLALGQLKAQMYILIPVAVGGSLLCFFLILLFVAWALRRMKKISIMDVISGENRGERFSKLPGLYLHRIRFIPVPLFLALTDLITRIKRYSFLIISYTLGITMMLIMLETYLSLVSPYWIETYWGYPSYDFTLELPTEVMEQYESRGGGVRGAYDLINQELKEHDIPAEVNYFCHFWERNLTFQGRNYTCMIQFNFPSKLEKPFYEGVSPVLANEVALDSLHAKKYGIKPGDTILVDYYKYNDDGITYSLVTEEFLVTGTIDAPTAYIEVTMSNAFTGAANYETVQIGDVIHAPERDKPAVIQRIRDLYGEGSVRDRDEATAYDLGDSGKTFRNLRDILIPMIGLLMLLVTVLYMSVNILDETPEIAQLKCSGFSNGSIKLWQILRALLILIASWAGSVLLVNTVAAWIIRYLFMILDYLMNYRSTTNVPVFYFLIPALLIAAILAVMAIVLRKVNEIELWRIRNE